VHELLSKLVQLGVILRRRDNEIFAEMRFVLQGSVNFGADFPGRQPALSGFKLALNANNLLWVTISVTYKINAILALSASSKALDIWIAQ